MNDLRGAYRSPRFVAAAIIAAGGILIYLLNFPGSMEDDSYVQLIEARTRSYSNWHPPIMSWMLGVSDSLIGPAAAWFTAFEMLVAFGVLAAMLWLPKRVSWPAAVCAGVMLLLPQLSLLQAVVWKDALFANTAVAGFVCIALAVVRWERQRLRYALLVVSAAFLAIAVLTRQNGIVVVPCAVAGLALAVAKAEARWRPGLVHAVAYGALTCVLAFAGNAALQLRADDYPAQQEQFKVLELYDITGMVNRHLDLPLAVLDKKSPRLSYLIRTEGVARWSPLKNDTLEESPRIVAALDATPAPVLARQWREVVSHHPRLYLAVRADLFHWVYQPPDVSLCHPFHVGDQGNPDDLKELGMKPRMDARDIMLWHYGLFFQHHTPAFSHGLYTIVCLGVAVLLLRRRNRADIVIVSLFAAAFVFTATFFGLSIACDYRYLFLIDLSALAGALYVAANWDELKTMVWRRKQTP